MARQGRPIPDATELLGPTLRGMTKGQIEQAVTLVREVAERPDLTSRRQRSSD